MNTNIPPSMDGENTILLSWTAPERSTHTRSRRWYIGAGIFIALCFLYSLMTQAWSFAVVIVALSALYFFCHKEEPAPKNMVISSHGFQCGSHYTSWAECAGFWMLQAPDYIELHIEHKKGLNKETIIHTGDADPVAIRETISQFLPEFTERHERILDIIIRLLKI